MTVCCNRGARSIVLFFLACGLASPLAAGDFDARREQNWHQWRGPTGGGVAPQGDPPVRWDTDTNIRWKAAIPGEGSGTPIVWDDRIVVLSAVETDRAAPQPPKAHADAKTRPPANLYQFVVHCLDRSTGKVVWRRVACEEVPHEGRHATNSYASASATTDGQRVYASFGSRGLFCYDLQGKFLWRRDLGDMRTRYGWGEAVSPVVHEGSLVVNWDHEDQSFIVCLDAATGTTRWRMDRDEPTSWATPLIVAHKSKPQNGGADSQTQVIVNGTNRVRSYDLATGKVIWQCGGQTVNAIPSPVRWGDAVLCMSGYRGALALAIPLDARGDITGTGKELWRHDKGTPYVPSPIVYRDHVYFTASNTAVLTCLEVATGKPVFEPRRVPGLGNLYASPAAAADRVYFVDRGGTTVVIKYGKQLEVLATNRLDDAIDASPVIVGKQLFLRGAKNLYCIEANP
jgi:outer membrane protein assembly factor BamB